MFLLSTDRKFCSEIRTRLNQDTSCDPEGVCNKEGFHCCSTYVYGNVWATSSLTYRVLLTLMAHAYHHQAPHHLCKSTKSSYHRYTCISQLQLCPSTSQPECEQYEGRQRRAELYGHGQGQANKSADTALTATKQKVIESKD